MVSSKIEVCSGRKDHRGRVRASGPIFGAILALFSLLEAAGGAGGPSPDALVFFGVLGFVFGLLTASLYKLAARFEGDRGRSRAEKRGLTPASSGR